MQPNGSSFSLFRLRVGLFDAFHESPFVQTSLVGFYPLVFYSKKVNVIPEALNAGVLPPLVLEKAASLRNYFHFMGSNPNLDTVNHHFVLNDTQVLLDAPDVEYSFVLSFDVITRHSLFSPIPRIRFNLVRFSLLYKDVTNSSHFLVDVILDLVIDNLQKSFDPGTNDFYYLGQVWLKGYYISTDNIPVPILRGPFQMVLTRTGTGLELVNVIGSMYKSLQTDHYEFSQLLSTQFLFFKVLFVIPVQVRPPVPVSVLFLQNRGSQQPLSDFSDDPRSQLHRCDSTVFPSALT